MCHNGMSVAALEGVQMVLFWSRAKWLALLAGSIMHNAEGINHKTQ